VGMTTDTGTRTFGERCNSAKRSVPSRTNAGSVIALLLPYVVVS